MSFIYSYNVSAVLIVCLCEEFFSILSDSMRDTKSKLSINVCDFCIENL